MEKGVISEGLAENDLADSCQITVNDAGTCVEGDTNLTQRRSRHVRGFVYFIRTAQYIKIGFSTRPLDRLRALQTAHPEELEIMGTREASRDLETELHAYLDDYRVRGEWFQAVGPIMDYIEENTPEGREAAATQARLKPPSPPLSDASKKMIAQLIQVRLEHGADTPVGHGCSNLIEMIPEMEVYVRPAWASDVRQTLPWLMNYQIKRLEQLTKAA